MPALLCHCGRLTHSAVSIPEPRTTQHARSAHGCYASWLVDRWIPGCQYAHAPASMRWLVNDLLTIDYRAHDPADVPFPAPPLLSFDPIPQSPAPLSPPIPSRTEPSPSHTARPIPHWTNAHPSLSKQETP